MHEVICIVCPKGCHLQVTQNEQTGKYEVKGATCERGIDYGINEVTNPVRVLTSTVRIEGSSLTRCPVRTDGSVPKARIMRRARSVLIQWKEEEVSTIRLGKAGSRASARSHTLQPPKWAPMIRRDGKAFSTRTIRSGLE